MSFLGVSVFEVLSFSEILLVRHASEPSTEITEFSASFNKVSLRLTNCGFGIFTRNSTISLLSSVESTCEQSGDGIGEIGDPSQMEGVSGGSQETQD